MSADVGQHWLAWVHHGGSCWEVYAGVLQPPEPGDATDEYFTLRSGGRRFVIRRDRMICEIPTPLSW